VLINTNKTMANKFINWIDRVGLPVVGFLCVTSATLLALSIAVRVIFDF
jgi:amino acid permease